MHDPAPSLSKANACLFVNPFIRSDWIEKNSRIHSMGPMVQTPDTVVPHISLEALEESRRGKQLACVDIVVCARRPNGEGVVLLSKRKPDQPFGDIWWMYGGSIRAYQDTEEFIIERLEKECGIRAKPEVLIGAYQTSCAGTLPQSTMQLCYATMVDYSVMERAMRTDDNHAEIRICTQSDLEQLSDDTEWCPKHACMLALENLPASS